MLIIYHIIFNRVNVIMYSTRPIKNILRIVTITTATGIHLWFDSNMIKHRIVADTHVYLYLQLHRYHKHIKN